MGFIPLLRFVDDMDGMPTLPINEPGVLNFTFNIVIKTVAHTRLCGLNSMSRVRSVKIILECCRYLDLLIIANITH